MWLWNVYCKWTVHRWMVSFHKLRQHLVHSCFSVQLLEASTLSLAMSPAVYPRYKELPFLFICKLLVRIPHSAIQTHYAGKHYSVSDKEEKVDGYNHSFTSCGCMHISHIDLLVNQVKICPFSQFISLCWATSGFPMMSTCYVIICVLVKNLKAKNLNILCTAKLHSYPCSFDQLIQPSVSFILHWIFWLLWIWEWYKHK